jgi:hypothetical protein
MSKNPITSRDVELLNSQGGTIATRGTVAKRSSAPVPVHPGMTSKQVAGMNAGGLSHPLGSVPDASSANPLDPTVPRKNLHSVELHPGMRSRTSPGLDTDAHKELGRLILASATRTK